VCGCVVWVLCVELDVRFLYTTPICLERPDQSAATAPTRSPLSAAHFRSLILKQRGLGLPGCGLGVMEPGRMGRGGGVGGAW